ncbi:hypothetical protein HPB50_016752 [Hyalomma asiaticum]|uniref:Uncharacterized protein n=1 Tax=Hyalomma asiaticum TaxID=266040 RepID=A0ACB7SFW8_HYAAI|nr:hypothetical protein HPB50_016752 [Hyalomma asiaticum]
MADETLASDNTSAPIPIESDDAEGEWITPGKACPSRILCTTIGSSSAVVLASLGLTIALSACKPAFVPHLPSTSPMNHIPVLHGALTVETTVHDITLRCTHTSPGEAELTLQPGLSLISDFLSRSGLQAAPEKSKLLLHY